MIVIRMLQDSLASIPLLKYAVERSKRKGSQLHRHIERMFDIALLLLNTTLETLERRSARVYAWFSNVLSVTPSGMYMPQDSAVVILGDIDDLGRAAALSFSELGYTVFMLSTAHSGSHSPSVTEKSSVVSSLLYVWHSKKERSPSANWGMVAPITLDTHSAAQRTDASETVHAYCQDHSLQLCALIVLPATSPARCSPGVLEHTNLPIKATPEDGLAFAMWEEDVESASWEPLTTMRDYFDLLMRASGRVILMSRCLPYNRDGIEQLFDGTRECLAMNLNQRLKPLGVRVCSLTTGAPGDFGQCSHRVSGDAVRAKQTRLSTEQATPGATAPEHNVCSGTPYFIAVCDVLESIVTTAYPKTSYTVGWRPWMSWAWRVAPDVARLLLRP